MRVSALRIVLPITVLLIASAKSFSQAPPANKPDGKTQPDPVNVTIVAPVPPAYANGVRVNYVRTKEAKRRFTNEAAVDEESFNSDGYLDLTETTQYFDGLGRQIQTVNRQTSPGASPNDMIIPVTYDKFGRETDKYLPYTSTATDGKLRLDPFTEQKNFLEAQFPGEQVYYGKTVFENSPLNRAEKTFAPGNSWAGSEGSANEHATKQFYLLNTAPESIRTWTVTSDDLTYSNNDGTTNIPATISTYGSGELSKNVTLDENGNAVVEYSDKEGLVILKKVQIGSIPSDYGGHDGFLCTYYIYDDLNQLRFVVPPKAVSLLPGSGWQLAANVINELCFRYEYDERARMIAKKVPGAGWVYMVYDKRDRLVFTQDANMKAKNQWQATLYDDLNRSVISGMITYAGGREPLQLHVTQNSGSSSGSTLQVSNPVPVNLSVVNRNTNIVLYKASNTISFEGEFQSEDNADFTTRIVPGSNGESQNMYVSDNFITSEMALIPLQLTFYDNYTWTSKQYGPPAAEYLHAGVNFHAEPLSNSANQAHIRGMQTGSKVRVIEDPNHLEIGEYLTTVNFYDDKGRVIQSNTDNYKGGRDVVTNRYDFAGRVVVSLHSHNTEFESLIIKTELKYDHAGRILEVGKRHFDPESIIFGGRIIVASNEYNETGQLKSKGLGKVESIEGPEIGPSIETLNYTYNIRGWLNGINKNYNLSSNSSDHWFGMELNYDWGFGHSQFNGNISGMKWRSRGDEEKRAYGFAYDKVNRLLAGDFSQVDASNYIDHPVINFDMMMGNGSDPASAYDENGNIRAMKQWGLKLGNSDLIDDLTYNYSLSGNVNTNKLLNVIDARNNSQTRLGDFKTSDLHPVQNKENSTQDYWYDANGNLTSDLNKDIGSAVTEGITYNHLNLPYKISFRNSTGEKGTITYIYDAAGTKLEKRIIDNTNQQKPLKKTSYAGNVVYEDDEIQFALHEEGRIRIVSIKPVYPTNTQCLNCNPAVSNRYKDLIFDYFIRDHLGNVRMVLTSGTKTDIYQAGMEDGKRLVEVELFGNKIAHTAVIKPGGFDTDNNNQKVSVVNGNSAENRVGPGVILKVMAGDRIKAKTYAWYQPGGDNNSDPLLPALVENLLSQLQPAVAGIGKGSQAANITNELLKPGMEQFLQNQSPQTGKPKAYLNWILLDEEQFKKVDASSGFTQVPTITGAEQKKLLEAAAGEGSIEIKKNGYIYVYLSNESRANVYFDDIRVEHIRGPLLEETHYYPFGLSMAGISSKAANSLENRHKFNDGTELTNDLDLNWYETNFRSYDPQIGRFLQIDELSEFDFQWSPYTYCLNNPILLIDPLGLTAEFTVANTDEPCPDCPTGKMAEVKELTTVVFVHKVKKKEESVGQPGTLESLIPIWGSGRAAVDDFQNGRWGWGIFNSSMVVADIFTFGLASTVIKSGVKIAAKEGVYVIVTRSGRYIGQSKNFLKRIAQHFGKGGKLTGQQLEKALLHEMPGSTKLEREVYEQYLIIKNGGTKGGILLNERNPMGGRMEKYAEMIENVINKFDLPR